uniref:Uncharacterized protein n=1 Tax=Megaselia scalaris TaxID=36166 RepID=T1GW87_MEGSC
MNSLQIKFNFQCNYNNHHRCYWFLVASFLLVNLTAIGQGSEFPERECCDLTTTTSTISPLSIPPIQATEKTITTSSASVQPISVGRSVVIIKTFLGLVLTPRLWKAFNKSR